MMEKYDHFFPSLSHTVFPNEDEEEQIMDFNPLQAFIYHEVGWEMEAEFIKSLEIRKSTIINIQQHPVFFSIMNGW